MKIVAECEVSEYVAPTIFNEYLKDCFSDFKDVPSRFLSNKSTMLEVSKLPTTDYAISVIGNLANGGSYEYEYATKRFADLTKNWLSAQNIELDITLEDEQKEQMQPLVQLKEQEFEVIDLSYGITSEKLLMQALYAIEKTDLCSEQSSQEDVMRFCKDVLKVVYNCKLPAYKATKIISNYLSTNCFTNFEEVPDKFYAFDNRNKKIGELSVLQSSDFAISVLGHLADGSNAVYTLVTGTLTEQIEQWLKINNVQDLKTLNLPKVNQQLENRNDLISKLYDIKRVNLCSEQTSEYEAMRFCHEMMGVIKDCKLSSSNGAEIFKTYLADCIDDFSNVPNKFLNKQQTNADYATQQTTDYAITIIGNLASGEKINYEYAIEVFEKENEKWYETQLQKENNLVM